MTALNPFQNYTELLTSAGGRTPEEIRRDYKTLRYSWIYAFYAKPGSLIEVPPEHVLRCHHSLDASGCFLLYIGQARRTSETRFLGVRCSKHCGCNSYEGQSQVRMGLCGIFLEGWRLKPCFKPNSRQPGKKFIWLNSEEKQRMTDWCDANLIVKCAPAPEAQSERGENSLSAAEGFLIQHYFPLLNTDPHYSHHPFTPQLKKLKDCFVTEGSKRPYTK